MNYKLMKSFLLFLIILCLTPFVQAQEGDVDTVDQLNSGYDTATLKRQCTAWAYPQPEGVALKIAKWQKPNNRTIFRTLRTKGGKARILGGQVEISEEVTDDIMNDMLNREKKIEPGREKDVGYVIDWAKKILICGYGDGECAVNGPIKVMLIGNDLFKVDDSHHSFIGLIKALRKLESLDFNLLLLNGTMKPLKVDELLWPLVVTTAAYYDLDRYKASTWLTYAINKKAYIGGDPADYREDMRATLVPFAEEACKILADRTPDQIPYGIVERYLLDAFAMRIPKVDINPETGQKNATKYHKENPGEHLDTVWVEEDPNKDFVEFGLIFRMRAGGIKFMKGMKPTSDLAQKMREIFNFEGLLQNYGIAKVIILDGKLMVDSKRFGLLPPESYREARFAAQKAKLAEEKAAKEKSADKKTEQKS